MEEKTLTSDLSIEGIRKLQQKLKNYQNELNRKNVIFVRRLAEVGIPIIDSRMAQAGKTRDSNNIESGSNTSHNTYIRLTAGTTYTVATLIVEGRDLLFIEFGAGAHYNGGAGKSPNKKGAERGYTIGSYGQGKGAQDSWTYLAPTGEWIRSYGTEATKPVYMASEQIRHKIHTIARQVFIG